jgi:hypothetical protein
MNYHLADRPALVSSGPISRVSEEPTYFVSDRQVRMLRRKKLPFRLISDSEISPLRCAT